MQTEQNLQSSVAFGIDIRATLHRFRTTDWIAGSGTGQRRAHADHVPRVATGAATIEPRAVVAWKRHPVATLKQLRFSILRGKQVFLVAGRLAMLA
jgi:hypothetical protein